MSYDILLSRLNDLKSQVKELEEQVYAQSIELLPKYDIAVVNALYPNAMELVLKYKGDDQSIREELGTLKIGHSQDYDEHTSSDWMSVETDDYTFEFDDNTYLDEGVFFFKGIKIEGKYEYDGDHHGVAGWKSMKIPIIIVFKEGY